ASGATHPPPASPGTPLFRSLPPRLHRHDPADPIQAEATDMHQALLRDRPVCSVLVVDVLQPAVGLSLDAHVLRQQRDKRDYAARSEEHTSELQSRENLVCRL